MPEIIPTCIWPVQAMLGEGPAWFADEQALRFVDIKGGKIHRYTPATSAQDSTTFAGQPSFVLPRMDGGLLIGSNCELIALGADGTDRTALATLPMPAHNRTNDATVDSQGRLWFGTMDDAETRPTGALYCYDRGALTCHGGESVVTNGPAISADCQTLYFVHSDARTIWRFTLDDDAQITRREIFLQLPAADGHPDGIVLDSEDCLWVALWDGWGLRRYAPDGTLLLHIHFPCARVTKLAFGGPNLTDAYVTTARIGLSADDLSNQPLAGGLFHFIAPAPGRRLPAVQC
ncbi:MAG: hypothetical protein RLY97_2117 [Pseudomonadota bacterium]